MANEREYFNKLVSNFGNEPAFVIDMFKQKKTVDEARNILLDRLRGELKEANLRCDFVNEDGGKLRRDMLKLHGDDEEKAFAAYKSLKSAEEAGRIRK